MNMHLKFIIAGALAVTALSVYVYAGSAGCANSGAAATDQATCSATDKAACGDKCAAGAGTCDKAACGDKCTAGAGTCAKAGAEKCAKPCDKCPAKKVAHVTTDQLSGLLGTVVVVDARTAKYDDGKRIPGALTVPADATPEQIAAALPDKSAKVVVYCTSPKCPASAKLAKTLVKHGYTAVQKYPDGIEGWVAAGKPTTQATPAGQ